VSSPQCWGYESPSQLNREVSSILSRGNPPPDDERHKWTHPSPVQSSARPVSCPLSAPGGGREKKFSAPLSVSPFQVRDQCQELRNHLYQAAHQHHSPFRFPFLPVGRYFPSLPPSPLTLPYPFPFPSYPYPAPGDNTREVGREVTNKRKYNETQHNQAPSSEKTESPAPRSTPSNISANNQPPYFRAGSMIQLADGNVKRVEHLQTEDFVSSAASCPDLSLEEATVTRLEKTSSSAQVTVTFSLARSPSERVTVIISPDHPFFVTGQGWSSYSPTLTMASFSLNCNQLALGDVCISLRPVVGETQEKSYKQVRFQDSPVPVKRKRLASPLNINVRVTQVPLHSDTSLGDIKLINSQTPA